MAAGASRGTKPTGPNHTTSAANEPRFASLSPATKKAQCRICDEPLLVGQAYRELRCVSIHLAPAHRRCVRRILGPSL